MKLLTLSEVARETGLPKQTVRRLADGAWQKFVVRAANGYRMFTQLPITTVTAAEDDDVEPEEAWPSRRGRAVKKAGTLRDREEPLAVDFKNARPVSQMDWALHWQDRGLVLFPCSRFLGDPLLPNWYAPPNKFATGGACNGKASIVSWWAQWPDADIAAVPWRSNHFVVVAVKEEGGYESLQKARRDLPRLDFEHWAPWGEHHLWFKTSSLVPSSSHLLGRGLHVVGPGRYVFLPNSRAPFIAQ